MKRREHEGAHFSHGVFNERSGGERERLSARGDRDAGTSYRRRKRSRRTLDCRRLTASLCPLLRMAT